MVKRITALMLVAFVSGVFGAHNAVAQEINCRISINSSAIQGSDRTVFEEMQKAANEFYNNTVFTNHVIKTQERIEFNMSITLKELSGADTYSGDNLQVTYSRPIYGSGYNSPVINIVDQSFQFPFALGDQPEYNINASPGAFSSLLMYYAYLILAIDYDTFELKGGQPFLELAERVVNNAQSESSTGWKAFENDGRNRAAIIEEMLQDIYEPVRVCWYEYHRLGLDMMSESPEQARGAIITAVEKLKTVYQRRRDSYLLQLFITAKSDEIIQIFAQGSPDEKRRAYNIMSTLDPANQDKYKRIMNAAK